MGFYHGVLLVVLKIFKGNKYKAPIDKMNFNTFLKIVITFVFVNIGWMIFRAPSITSFYNYVSAIFTMQNWLIPVHIEHSKIIILSLVILIALEYKFRKQEFPFKSKILSPVLAALFFWFIIVYRGGASEFIYFNF